MATGNPDFVLNRRDPTLLAAEIADIPVKEMALPVITNVEAVTSLIMPVTSYSMLAGLASMNVAVTVPSAIW